ncbi:MAG: GldL-related protein [Thiohalospira sp.]
MAILDEKQVNHIYDLLVGHGVSYEALQVDLLDHICCMVEKRMDNGQDFDQSLTSSIHEFGLLNLSEIQEATLYLITLKLQKMKKTTGIFGIISSLIVIIGVFLKIGHLPGANITLVTGLAIISILVFPFMAFIELKNKKEKSQLIATITIYLSATILSISGMFKIMHWPGSLILFDIGTALIIFVFIPLFTIKNYKTAENKIFAIAKSLLIIAGIIVLWGLVY